MKNYDERIRRLEKKRGLNNGISPILDALRNRTEEQIISLLVGSELFPRLELKEAKRIAQEIKQEIRE